eukprot:2129516-Rhodomonas_salina.1
MLSSAVGLMRASVMQREMEQGGCGSSSGTRSTRPDFTQRTLRPSDLASHCTRESSRGKGRSETFCSLHFTNRPLKRSAWWLHGILEAPTPSSVPAQHSHTRRRMSTHN